MNIILIGFMGSGKSSISRLLSQKLSKTLIDMDDEVVKLSGRKNIKEIFEHDGEVKFRELEVEVAKNLRETNNSVIATGGGVVVNRIIIDYLKQSGVIIYFKTSFETIKKRLGNPKDRPLFNDFILAKKLYDFRQPLYQEYAELIVDTDHKNKDQIAEEILKQIKGKM